MKQLTAIAISGGVDSLTAAYLLKKQGHKLIGIHFITGYEAKPFYHKNIKDFENSETTPSSTKDYICQKVSKLAEQLGICIEIIDCSAEFKKNVVDNFIQTYKAGKTPNPCMVCNTSIKFGTVLDFARKMGAKHIATGHYARVIKDRKNKHHLLKGIDQQKDQSYFLALLKQKQLAGACFPLGDLTKSEVLKISKEKKLKPIVNRESQDICFIKDNNYGYFLEQQQSFKPKPGLIKDIKGNLLGEHRGLHLYTIGQRKGINCPASEPYYVVSIDIKHNILIVGSKKDLLLKECKVIKINWINQKPTSPIKIYARIRYRHKAVEASLLPIGKQTAIVKFKNPQSAITPGQGAVFYKADEVIGGGWIES
ncbi:MAG: tRNA 2-thiouridine(34) synthase MnmA [Proteobacteria bacterium]|nr:tRNA 2-thiouridine(34) synthase MnmA [Pseudomonadota bacterium]